MSRRMTAAFSTGRRIGLEAPGDISPKATHFEIPVPSHVSVPVFCLKEQSAQEYRDSYNSKRNKARKNPNQRGFTKGRTARGAMKDSLYQVALCSNPHTDKERKTVSVMKSLAAGSMTCYIEDRCKRLVGL